MADKSIDILVDLQVQENRVKRELEKINPIIKEADRRTVKYKNAVKATVAAEVKLASIRRQRIAVNKQMVNSTKQLTKAQVQMKNSSGAASSAAMELGRVVSDAPYGIRGMANNITQLVSQLGFATTAAGGFGLALKQMWKALMGPLGVVFAITAAVAALDWFAGEQTKVKDETEEATSELEKQKKALEELTEDYEDYLKVREGVVQATSKEREMLKALVSETLDLSNSEERRKIALGKLIKLYPKYFSGKNIDNIKGIFDAEKNVDRVLKNKLKLKEALNKAEELANAIQIERLKNQELSEQGKRPNLKRISELLEEQKQVRELVRVYAAMDFSFKENEVDPKDKVGLLDLPDEAGIGEDAKRMKKYYDALKHALREHVVDNPLEIVPTLDTELSPETKEAIAEYNDKVAQEYLRKSRLEDFSKYAGEAQKALSSINDFISAQHDRQLTIEQNHTNSLNEELNNRLLNENLSADERANIQNKIAQNDEALRQKQNAIKKKQFNSQKAFNIANAVIDTGRAAAGVLADTKGGSFARIAGMIAVVGAGLAQVATIASAKFQPDAASTPIRTSSSGGGGGVGDRTFDFNLIGNNQQNQLADVIGSQFNKPLKAYVVSKDITNQQQLDANTKATARFGD